MWVNFHRMPRWRLRPDLRVDRKESERFQTSIPEGPESANMRHSLVPRHEILPGPGGSNKLRHPHP